MSYVTGFWIRTSPSKAPDITDVQNTEVEGPILLASTHIDFSELEESSTEHIPNEDLAPQTDTSTIRSITDDKEFDHTSEEKIAMSRHKSISGNLFPTSTISFPKTSFFD